MKPTYLYYEVSISVLHGILLRYPTIFFLNYIYLILVFYFNYKAYDKCFDGCYSYLKIRRYFYFIYFGFIVLGWYDC